MTGKVTMPIIQPRADGLYELAVDWTVEYTLFGYPASLAVRKGFVFDGASIPRALWRICGEPMEAPRVAAALAHDWLYGAHVCTREEADETFRTLLADVGIGWIRRTTEYLALRLFGGFAWNDCEQADIDFAREHGALAVKTERN